MRRACTVIATVLLVAVAGFTATGVSTPRPDAPATPLQPSQSANATPACASNGTASFPPGTSASGITNATRLLDDHRDHLNDTTYVERGDWGHASRVTDENGTVRGFDTTRVNTTVEKGAESTLFVIEDENDSTSFWFEGDAVASRNSYRGEGVTFYVYERAGSNATSDTTLLDRRITRIGGSGIASYLLGVDYECADTVTRENRTLYRFTSTGLNDTAENEWGQEPFPPWVDRVDATVLVDRQGIVRSLDATAVHAAGNRSVSVRTTYSVSRTGNVTPTTPDWVTAELPHLNASLTGNGTVLALNHSGGTPVSTAALLVGSPNRSSHAEFSGTFEPGDTLYLYLVANDTERVRASLNDRPDANESFVRLGPERPSLSVHRMVREESNRTTTEIRVTVDAPSRNRSLVVPDYSSPETA